MEILKYKVNISRLKLKCQIFMIKVGISKRMLEFVNKVERRLEILGEFVCFHQFPANFHLILDILT